MPFVNQLPGVWPLATAAIYQTVVYLAMFGLPAPYTSVVKAQIDSEDERSNNNSKDVTMDSDTKRPDDDLYHKVEMPKIDSSKSDDEEYAKA